MLLALKATTLRGLWTVVATLFHMAWNKFSDLPLFYLLLTQCHWTLIICWHESSYAKQHVIQKGAVNTRSLNWPTCCCACCCTVGWAHGLSIVFGLACWSCSCDRLGSLWLPQSAAVKYVVGVVYLGGVFFSVFCALQLQQLVIDFPFNFLGHTLWRWLPPHHKQPWWEGRLFAVAFLTLYKTCLGMECLNLDKGMAEAG
jgi:hypothetical protein